MKFNTNKSLCLFFQSQVVLTQNIIYQMSSVIPKAEKCFLKNLKKQKNALKKKPQYAES